MDCFRKMLLNGSAWCLLAMLHATVLLPLDHHCFHQGSDHGHCAVAHADGSGDIGRACPDHDACGGVCPVCAFNATCHLCDPPSCLTQATPAAMVAELWAESSEPFVSPPLDHAHPPRAPPV